jgi:hypothetical protein
MPHIRFIDKRVRSDQQNNGSNGSWMQYARLSAWVQFDFAYYNSSVTGFALQKREKEETEASLGNLRMPTRWSRSMLEVIAMARESIIRVICDQCGLCF